MRKNLLCLGLFLASFSQGWGSSSLSATVALQQNPRQAQLTVHGATASVQYLIQRSTNLVSWSDLDTVTAPSSDFVYPDSSIGQMPRVFYRVVMLPLISRTNWTLLYADSEETVAENGHATRAFDGDVNTYWVTQWQAVPSPVPHEIQIDLGATYTLGELKYLPRQDGVFHGDIGAYEVYVSTDGLNWDQPVATGIFPKTSEEQSVGFPSKNGRYVRLRALTEVDAEPSIAIAEINLLQVNPALNQVPQAVIDFPGTDMTIAVGGSVSFAAHANDPDNNLPLDYRWSFGVDSGISDSLVQAPGTIIFNNPGTFVVALTVTDSLGMATRVTRTITVQSSVATLVLRTGWRVNYVDSQETGHEDGAATNVFDGSSSSAWVTEWFDAAPRPPHEIQIDLGATHNLCGFRYLPRQDLIPNGRIADYEFYISQDGLNWGNPVALGRFANTVQEKEVLFVPASARYIRFRALSEVNDKPWTVVAELNLLQIGNIPNQAPTATIDAPSGPVTIMAGCAIDFSATASDGNGNLPLQYHWSFGSLPAIDDINVEDPGLVRFSTPGIYNVSLTVADALSLSTVTGRTITVLGGGTPIPRAGWSLLYKDSEETVGENGSATRAFDGDPTTYWVTKWFNGVAPMPHEIQINLGGTYNVAGFRYLPRQDGNSNGDVGVYDFYVSADGVNWDVPVATGRLALSDQEQTVQFAPKLGHYVRFRALSEVQGGPWTAIAEFNVLQAQALAPWVRLTRPQSNYLQTSSDLNVTANASLTTGQGLRFMIDGGAANGGAESDQYNSPYQALFPGITPGSHVVDVFVIDAGGAVVGGPGTHDRAVQVGIGESYVAMGDSITLGFGDDISSDDSSQDGRTTGGGYPPILADSLTSSLGHPIVIANEGISADTSTDGVLRCPAVLKKYPFARRFLIMYGANGAEPSGKGLSPGLNGYAGSFKDNMQRIINDVNTAGKVPVLAKISARLPLDSPANTRIKEYNDVIAELIADPANQITTPAPDFYTYFHDHPDQLLDGLHPNGAGYQGMANLWFGALTP
jgi:lysophospholipase L1-like esterase